MYHCAGKLNITSVQVILVAHALPFSAPSFPFIMSTWSRFALCLAFILLPASEAAECKARAISFPFRSNVLANRAEARGIPWQIGSPNAQTIAVLPSASVFTLQLSLIQGAHIVIQHVQRYLPVWWKRSLCLEHHV